MSEIELWVTERDGTRIAPLPEANLSDAAWILNNPGPLSFNIDPLSEGAREIEGIAREIQGWWDGELRWWGVPWGLTGNSRSINVACQSLMSLFNVRFVDRTSMFYTSIDQFSIAWDLLQYAQSEAVEANRDFNIQSSFFSPSGVPRSRDWKRDEHANIHDAVKSFDSRSLLNGFDWEIEFTGDGGRFWTPYYPRKGQLRPELAVEWREDGERNIADFTWTEDFLPLATLAYVTGGSVSTESVTIKMEGKYEDLAASAYWGQIQTIISEGTQLDVNWLEDRAEQEVNDRKDPKVITEITSAIGVEVDALGQVKVGDWVPVFIDCGRIQVDALHRIEQIKWNPNDTLSYSFGEVVAA